MTDVRARIAEALGKHWLLGDSPLRCTCGWRVPAQVSVIGPEFNRHVAGALLALDGIAVVDREMLQELLELHQSCVWTSAPYSEDGENDDLCCSSCDRLGDRNTLTKPTWPCETRELLDALLEVTK